uniref:Polysaccharide pyruvyl transferase domain-containing protein n=1 Tax=Paulinella chromatophora TaxID=39717 RepID=B1X3V1_PAUCH|nr:hypothetical protein PCC_0170 [Paulinella chromatophora]ACB42620.1 hypothetical protein PCC_0170 [Paulinella chromatophora]
MQHIACKNESKVLICGYYGEGNIGDDAILEAILSRLPDNINPIVTAANQNYIKNHFGVSTVSRRSLVNTTKTFLNCHTLVLGSGSLLQDTTSFRSLLYYATLITIARIQGKSILLWAQGLGPLRRKKSRFLVQQLLFAVTNISWRDKKSKQVAELWGIKGHLEPDPVWALPRRIWNGYGGPIVVCWRPTDLLDFKRWRVLLLELDSFSYRLKRDVWWIPFHLEQDLGLLKDLQLEDLIPQRLSSVSREYSISTPEEALSIFDQASLVLSMRLHALILSNLAGAPCAALSYDPKVSAVAESMKIHCTDLASTDSILNAVSNWKKVIDRSNKVTSIECIGCNSSENAKKLRNIIK